VSDLVEFLRARLDEEEAITRAAADRIPDPRTWRRMWTETHDVNDWPDPDAAAMADHLFAHIIDWSPTRVLANIAANRAVLAIHRPCHGGITEPWGCEHGHVDEACETGVPDVPAVCVECTYDDRTVAYPCPTVLAVAQPYAGHPDFDPAWRTDA
jgi:hypothetical protein